MRRPVGWLVGLTALALAGACDRRGAPEVHARLDRLADALDALGRALDGTPPPDPPLAPTRSPLPELGDAPSDGPADARVTIVVGYEFACPYSARLWPTLEYLRHRHPQDVRVVALHLLVHVDEGALAARAGCAAAAQGRFFDYARVLFAEGQPAMAQGGLARAALLADAERLGLDLARFTADLDGPACAARVADERTRLLAAGLRGTPILYIAGERVPAATPVEELEARIARALTGP